MIRINLIYIQSVPFCLSSGSSIQMCSSTVRCRVKAGAKDLRGSSEMRRRKGAWKTTDPEHHDGARAAAAAAAYFARELYAVRRLTERREETSKHFLRQSLFPSLLYPTSSPLSPRTPSFAFRSRVIWAALLFVSVSRHRLQAGETCFAQALGRRLVCCFYASVGKLVPTCLRFAGRIILACGKAQRA